MIIHPKVVFVENPRTASSYIADLLIEDGGERFAPRHGGLPEPSVGKPSFVVVRNPYQRAYSCWRYMDQIDQLFDNTGDWVENSNHFFAKDLQVDLTENVDTVLRFEDLGKTLPKFFEDVGLGHLALSLEKAKTHKLSKSDKEKVAKVFKKDFTELGYKV